MQNENFYSNPVFDKIDLLFGVFQKQIIILNIDIKFPPKYLY